MEVKRVTDDERVLLIAIALSVFFTAAISILGCMN